MDSGAQLSYINLDIHCSDAVLKDPKDSRGRRNKMSSKKANRVLVLVLLLIVLPAISIGMHRRLISLFNRLLSLFSIIFLFFIKLYELRKEKKNKLKNLSKYNQHVLLEVCNMFFRHAKANDLIH